MPLINCKVELKFIWAKYCLFSVAGNDNTNYNRNNISTIKDTKLYVPDHRKHRYELAEESKKWANRKLAIKVIMDCRTTSPNKFRKKVGFKQYDIILTKKQSVLTKIMSSFEREKLQTQYNVLSYRIDWLILLWL